MATTQDSSIVIDTKEGMQAFRMLQLKFALSIEVKTGMTHSRGSVMKEVNRTFGTSFRKKADALAFMEGVCAYMAGETTELPEVKGMYWQV